MILGFVHPITGARFPLPKAFEELSDVVPEGFLRALITKEELDTRHQGDGLTITSGLGCPRKWFIQRAKKVHVDPQKMWAAQRGTFLHEHMGHASSLSEDWYTEELNEDKCVFEGELFGLKMSCKMDLLRRDYSELADFKFRNPYAVKYLERLPDGTLLAGESDRAQLNMGKMLMEQQLGMDLSNMVMTVWVDSGGWHRTKVLPMSLHEIGAVRPGGGKHTVRDIFSILNTAIMEWRALKAEHGENVPEEKLDAVVRSIPMVGMDMYKGKRGGQCACSHYCEVKDACYDVEGGM